jgi:hypothetical protein
MNPVRARIARNEAVLRAPARGHRIVPLLPAYARHASCSKAFMMRSSLWLHGCALALALPVVSYMWACASYAPSAEVEAGSLCTQGETAACSCTGTSNSGIRRCTSGHFGTCECGDPSSDAGVLSTDRSLDAALQERGIETRVDAGEVVAADTVDSGSIGTPTLSPDDTCATHLAAERTSDIGFNSSYIATPRFIQFRNDTNASCGLSTPGPDGVDSYLAGAAGTMKVKVTNYQGLGMPVLSIRRGTGACASLVERSCGSSPIADPYESIFSVANKERVFIFWDTTGTSFTNFSYEVSLAP